MALAPGAGGGWSGDTKRKYTGGGPDFMPTPTAPVFGSPNMIPQMPKMPFDFSGFGNLLGQGGGGGGGGFPGFKNFPKPTPPKGLPEELGNPTDMTKAAVMAARDAGTSALKEFGQQANLRLGPGVSTPGAAARIGAETLRNLNRGTLEAENQAYNQKVAGYNAATGRYEADIGGYRAQMDAWSAWMQAQAQMQSMRLQAQIAAMNAMMGMWGNMWSGMGSAFQGLGSAMGGAGNMSGFGGAGSAYPNGALTTGGEFYG